MIGMSGIQGHRGLRDAAHNGLSRLLGWEGTETRLGQLVRLSGSGFMQTFGLIMLSTAIAVQT